MKIYQTLFLCCTGAFFALAFFAGPAPADSDKQNMAREAMIAGEIAPLSKLLNIVESKYPGDVLKVEMEHEDIKKWGGKGKGKIYIYEIKVLTLKGNLVKLKYDAKTLKILSENGINRRKKHDKKESEEKNDESNHYNE